MPYPLIDDEPFLSLGDRDEEPASQQVVPVPFGPGHVGTTCLGRRSVFRNAVPLGKYEEGEAILSVRRSCPSIPQFLLE